MKTALRIVGGMWAVAVSINAIVSLVEHQTGSPNTLKWARPWS